MIDLDFSDIKPSVYSWLTVGLMAITFIVLVKFLVNKYNNPATNFLKDFINAV